MVAFGSIEVIVDVVELCSFPGTWILTQPCGTTDHTISNVLDSFVNSNMTNAAEKVAMVTAVQRGGIRLDPCALVWLHNRRLLSYLIR